LSLEARARGFAELAAEISVGIFPGDYSEAGIAAFAAETAALWRRWEDEDVLAALMNPPPPPFPRKLTLASAVKQAAKAGVKLASYEVRLDGSTVITVTDASESNPPNPWLEDLKVTKQ
jgi:hypothetical protein